MPPPGDIPNSLIAPEATDPVALALHEEADNALSHQNLKFLLDNVSERPAGRL